MASSAFKTALGMDVPYTIPPSPDSTPRPLRIALVTDAWQPQVNGVVRTWTEVVRELKAMGHEVHVIEPGQFRTWPMPRYPEIRLALRPGRTVARKLQDIWPDAVHIATEGPLGCAARRYCGKCGWAFTTSYHTQFPLYLKRYARIPPSLTYRFIRWFHGPARAVLVPTQRVAEQLAVQRLNNTVVWMRGVDTTLFRPMDPPGVYDGLVRPVFVYAGRVAVEKNIEAFLQLDLHGSKVVVGDGPAKAALQKKYPHVHWAGYQFGEALAQHYAAADVFVFPSLTDTFGVVMLEANACGLPVAAHPVTGPIDVIEAGVNGVLHDDLRQACIEALHVNPEGCRSHAKTRSWTQCAQMFVDTLAVRTIA